MPENQSSRRGSRSEVALVTLVFTDGRTFSRKVSAVEGQLERETWTTTAAILLAVNSELLETDPEILGLRRKKQEWVIDFKSRSGAGQQRNSGEKGATRRVLRKRRWEWKYATRSTVRGRRRLATFSLILPLRKW